MKALHLLSDTALRSGLGVALVLSTSLPVHALAQDTPSTAANPAITADAETDANTIVVTGSRIPRPNLESAVPITSVSGAQLYQTGKTSIGDTLNELPQLRSTFSQSNSTDSLGTAGLNLLDLRGLGTSRTLVLQNGRRHVASDVLNNAVSPDINTFPEDLIERIDIVTGGNSAVYGSDAIAGVVNFVLKRDYEGIQLRAQNGVSKYGDDQEGIISLLAGANFAEDRGNIAVDLTYSHHGNAYASHRPNLRVNSRFVTVDTDPSDTPSDGVFDNVFFRDVRFPFFNNGGEFIECCVTGASGGTNLFSYLFQPDGTLVPQTGTITGNDYFDTRYIGGNGSTAREGKLLILQPIVNRYSANAFGHYTISDAFEPFFEAKYVRIDTRGSTSGPFFTGLGTLGSPREIFNTGNPFLNPQAKAIINDYYGAGPDDDVDFGFSRTVTDFGVRDEEARRQTYRIVAGVQGDLGNNWKYEVSGNYGRFSERTKVLGNVNIQRYLLAIDAVDQGQILTGTPNGNIVCRSSVTPGAGIAFENAADPAYAASQLANDVAQCVPVNLFGEGNVSQAAKNYILQDTVARGKITQLDFSGYIAGDTGKWFSLPGGPIGLSLGAEYRRETASYLQDVLVTSGLTFYNSIPALVAPSFVTKEVFGEIKLPILKDLPFIEELTLSGAGRISDIKGATGTVYAYNGQVEWAPVRGLRFRGGYGRSVRAPNLTELYSQQGVNFAPDFSDPCSADNIGTGSQFRAANCAAAGRPADYNYQYTSSLQLLSGGNPDLKEETSDSWTAGMVAQPAFIPGFALSVDYYDITVNKVITAVEAQDIADACYDLPDLNNPFCGLFQRQGAGTGPRGEIPFRILEGSLLQVPLNYAKLKVRGIDVDVSYQHEIGDLGKVSTRLVYNHVLQNDQFLNPTDPNFADRIMYELGDPRDRFSWDVAWQTGPVTVNYEMRYIGKMVVNDYEDFFSVQGRPPQNDDYAERHFYQSVLYHDINLEYEFSPGSSFYVGVDNVTNRLPPLGLTGVGAGSGVYSNIGRFFYAGIKAKIR